MTDYTDGFTQGRDEALQDVRELFEDATGPEDLVERFERLLIAHGVL